jgi:dTDP-glucose 4,6-dehydratase
MKILVTGGMGFMGSNFIRYIYEKYPSDEIVNFDALTYAGNPDNLADIEDLEAARSKRRYLFVRGDIAEPEDIKRAVAAFEPDVIVNFAAESHVDRSLISADEFIRANVVGVQNLIQLSKEHFIKFLQISTDEIYGDVLDGYSTEDSPIRPSNPYAASKAGADLLVQSYIRSHGAPALIVRGSNNFGPYQYPEKLIPLAITNIIEGAKIPVHGSGKHIRTWLHVDDFVRGVDLVLREGSLGGVYNLAGHEESNLGLLKRIADHLSIEHADALEHVGDRPGADLRYAPHAGKIERELGWTPKHHIHDALPDVVRWYKENHAWWKKVKQRKEFLEHYEKQRQAKYY